MKIGIHSFIGSVISLLVLETKSDDGVCIMWNVGYYECDKTVGGTQGFVIPENVSADAKGIQLKKGGSDLPWIIDDINYFQRYPELVELAIAGPVKIVDSLSNTEAKQLELQEKLFYLVKMKLISCVGCNFYNDYMWRLPWEIERFVFVGNSYKEYNFTYSPYLIEVNLENNHLKKMPFWYDKTAPLQELYLLNNPDLRITFDDIAMFCELTAFSMDAADADYINQQEYACDCYRMKKWLTEFEIMLIIDRSGSTPKDSHALKCYKVVHCPAEKMEDYRKKKESCNDKRAQKVYQSKHKPPFKASPNLQRMAFFIVFATFTVVAGGLMLHVQNKSRKRKKRKHRKAVHDKG